jgi:TM2 domain-containing membrane protein YozV
MYCVNCGKEISDQARYCPNCGQPAHMSGMAPGFQNDKSVSPRSRLASLLFCLFLGWLGVHRFYVGKVGTGILMLITVGGFGIWVVIDFIMIVVGGFTDLDGKYVLDWQM